MPNKCIVPGCKGNYKNGPKVTCFSFPSEESQKQKWLHAIPRKDFKITQYSRVCHLHFLSSELEWEVSVTDSQTGVKITAPLERPRLVRDAVPSQFPNCPSYLSSKLPSKRPSRDDRAFVKENEQLVHALKQSRQSHADELAADICSSLSDVQCKINPSLPWSTTHHPTHTDIYQLKSSSDSVPQVSCAIHISQDLQMTVYLHGVSLPQIGDLTLPHQLSSIKNITNSMDLLSNLVLSPSPDQATADEAIHINMILQLVIHLLKSIRDTTTSNMSTMLWFICEQLSLLIHLRYSPDFLVFASLFYNVSPHAYRFLRDSGKCILPSLSTIRRITMSSNVSPLKEQNDKYFLHYIRQKSKSLTASDFTVFLLVDEIHLKPYFDYIGGQIVGAAINSREAATTACAFMITSVFSKFKDVVHVMPCLKMNAEVLFSMIKHIVVGLESVGFKILGVITDNNAVNRKAMSHFASPPVLSCEYHHPCDHSRPLFYIFDAVHIFKSVRNNWLNLKNFGKSMVYPPFQFDDIVSKDADLDPHDKSRIAPLDSLNILFNAENGKLVKYAYTLSSKALNPSSLERQKVFLVTKIFNDYVSQGLLSLGPKHNIPHYADCSIFIKIITRWWQIVNVKTPLKGQRLNNKYEEPLTIADNCSQQFLLYFLKWLNIWKNMDSNGKLTNETHIAISQTTEGLLRISSYCFNNLNASYILLGKFQTDSLEARFGQYRQLAGGQYHVSLRQVFECEKKLRLLSVLQLKISDDTVTLSDFSIDWSDYSNCNQGSPIEIEPLVDSDFERSQAELPVLVYLAGYCVHSIYKKLKCETCKENLTCPEGDVDHLRNSYTQRISRGGLLYPHEDVVRIVQVNYIVISRLCVNTSFLCLNNQRACAVQTSLEMLPDYDSDFFSTNICDVHSCLELSKLILWSSANAMLNNFCNMKNDFLKGIKKRKIQTLV